MRWYLLTLWLFEGAILGHRDSELKVHRLVPFQTVLVSLFVHQRHLVLRQVASVRIRRGIRNQDSDEEHNQNYDQD